MSFRWTPEALAAFEKRKKEWDTTGQVRTHTIARRGEALPGNANKKGGRKKFGSIETEVDGFKFASKREAKRWGELRLMEKAGQIKKLARQVVYDLTVNGIKVCDYIADFVYEKPELTIEDCKGMRTPVYILKAKLMKAVHGIEILET